LDQRPCRRLRGDRRRAGAAGTDNTKVAVIKACLYDPQINSSYADMAAHYGTAILPARPPRRPDKAKVEQAVLMVEWSAGRSGGCATAPSTGQRGDPRLNDPA
jgi:hypothetical protein